jgi:polyhydroxybutyrate depolymerase
VRDIIGDAGRRPGRRWAAAVAVVAIVAVGTIVGPATVTAAGSASRGTIVSDGIARTYRLYVPGSLRAGVRPPLVVVLHGHGGTSEQVARSSRFDAEAERGRFIAAYPDGIDHGWNDADLGRLPDLDDVGFIRRLIDALIARYRVDPARVYAAGMSNGGFMAERLACDLPDRVAAIGAVAASRRAECASDRPVSVMHVHGVRDPLVRYDGSDGGAIGAYPSQSTLAGWWRAVDGCAGTPRVASVGVVRREVATACDAGTAVVAVAIRTAGHEWPGGTGARTPASTFDTTHELWTFFAAHPRP